MKKSILKKLVVFSCFAAVLFTSCEKEPLEEENANYISNIKKTKVNFADFKENKKAFDVFKNLNLTDTKPNIKNLNVQNATSYNFEIDFNDGTHLSYHNLESYTFPIKRVTDNGLLENIVISEHTDGKYYAKLLKYNLTSQEKIDLANDELKSIQNPIVTEVLGEYNFGNQIQSNCGYESIQVITSCSSGDHHSGNIIEWYRCTADTKPSLKTITQVIDCNDGGGGGGTGDGSSGYYGNPFFPGGGGGYITPSFPNETTPTDYYENGISEPVLSTADAQLFSQFLNDLRAVDLAGYNYLYANPEIKNQIFGYLATNIFSNVSVAFAKELTSIIKFDSNTDVNTLKFVLAAKYYNQITNDLDEAFLVSMDQYIDASTIDPIVTEQLTMYFSIQCAVLRSKHSTWSDLEIYWAASKEMVHITLDILGLVPLFGEVADLTNGLLYTIEGDGVNATLSVAQALPLAGWAAFSTKYAIKIKTAYQSSNKIKLVWKILGNGDIYFGTANTCRAQLRKALNMTVGNLNQAHHIIPLNLQTNTVVQRAFKSADAFHLNEALNGISLSTAVHIGSHNNYDNLIRGYLNTVPANATPQQCFNKVEEVINKVRIAIANSPNTPINQLIF